PRTAPALYTVTEPVPVPEPEVLFTKSVPALSVVPPAYVLAPLSVTVPEVVFTSATVEPPASPTFTVPLRASKPVEAVALRILDEPLIVPLFVPVPIWIEAT